MEFTFDAAKKKGKVVYDKLEDCDLLIFQHGDND